MQQIIKKAFRQTSGYGQHNLFAELYETIQKELDNIDDKYINNCIETLKFIFPEEDFSKMDKMTILYRNSQLL